MAEKIKVNDVVYQKKRGWSGVPMRVLELDDTVALCKGALGWTVAGLFSGKHKAYVERYAIKNLTHAPDSEMT